jgi:hypothetical protein
VLQRSLAVGVIEAEIMGPVWEFRDESAAALAEHCSMMRKNTARRENPVTLAQLDKPLIEMILRQLTELNSKTFVGSLSLDNSKAP